MVEITREYIDQLQEDIAAGRDSGLREIFAELHPADIAEVFGELKADEVVYVYRLLSKEVAADVVVELNEDVQEKLLSSLTSLEIARDVLDHIDSDDAADMISDLSDEKIEEIISHIEDETQASDLIDLLNYEEGTAGALMAKELVKVNQNWNITQCVREMRKQAADLENIYSIYVVDDHEKLLGTLSLKNLLFSSSSTRTVIKDLYNPKELQTVLPTDDVEYVVRIMEKYDIAALPVVNEGGYLLGRITFDDAMDVLREESGKDYQLASGISEDVEFTDSVFTLTRARLPWLLIGMAGGLAGAHIIGVFDIQNNPSMALFIPLIAAMGGNVGVQSAAIVVQGLANNSIDTSKMAARLTKEFGVGILNGVICAIVILFASSLLSFDLEISITVSIALLFVIIFAALFGTFIPLILNKYKIDPAIATGPFITTSNDIIGLMIYFSIGHLVSSLL